MGLIDNPTDRAGSRINEIDMGTFKFGGIKVRVTDLKNDKVDFRVVEVFNLGGKMVYEIRTTAKGRRAAKVAYATALHFRYI